jgi:hypothetical protein
MTLYNDLDIMPLLKPIESLAKGDAGLMDRGLLILRDLVVAP